MLTGDTRAVSSILARDAGVNDYLSKPVGPEVLQRMIDVVLGRPRPYIDSKGGYFGPYRRRRQSDNLNSRRSNDRRSRNSDPTDSSL